ncbi:unnamed protein product (mitochondrion) [Plasmodiophora brassicae]|uniref:Uncharacterized protein n=1 Tax=Plasmodiophora brassicae TaxID=37360 RepID=A0A0G4IZC2_PLABS|nr:hypothetical protein PBRA_001742 [Plasmodiophora brassicae]SPQ93828.1 unnamed protein product [Plasmodiophora brassicae]
MVASVGAGQAARQALPTRMTTNRDKLVRYGGPNPLFTKAYGWFLLLNCIYLFVAPLSVARVLFLNSDESVHSTVVFFGRLYGLAGMALCMQLLAEPILTKRQSLLTGLTACVCSMVVMRNRHLLSIHMHVFWTFFFSLVGVYFVIRSPHARASFKVSAKPHQF